MIDKIVNIKNDFDNYNFNTTNITLYINTIFSF
jgi:hypothetical protein